MPCRAGTPAHLYSTPHSTLHAPGTPAHLYSTPTAHLLTLSAHVAALCRSGYYQLRQLCPLDQSMTAEAARTEATADSAEWSKVTHATECFTSCVARISSWGSGFGGGTENAGMERHDWKTRELISQGWKTQDRRLWNAKWISINA